MVFFFTNDMSLPNTSGKIIRLRPAGGLVFFIPKRLGGDWILEYSKGNIETIAIRQVAGVGDDGLFQLRAKLVYTLLRLVGYIHDAGVRRRNSGERLRGNSRY